MHFQFFTILRSYCNIPPIAKQIKLIIFANKFLFICINHILPLPLSCLFSKNTSRAGFFCSSAACVFGSIFCFPSFSRHGKRCFPDTAAPSRGTALRAISNNFACVPAAFSHTCSAHATFRTFCDSLPNNGYNVLYKAASKPSPFIWCFLAMLYFKPFYVRILSQMHPPSKHTLKKILPTKPFCLKQSAAYFCTPRHCPYLYFTR